MSLQQTTNVRTPGGPGQRAVERSTRDGRLRLRRREGCSAQHPRFGRTRRPGQPRCNSSAGGPWTVPVELAPSGGLGPDGCPGFKGPVPQPVSMSAPQCRWRCGVSARNGVARHGKHFGERSRFTCRNGVREPRSLAADPEPAPESLPRHGRRGRSPQGWVHGVLPGRVPGWTQGERHRTAIRAPCRSRCCSRAARRPPEPAGCIRSGHYPTIAHCPGRSNVLTC